MNIIQNDNDEYLSDEQGRIIMMNKANWPKGHIRDHQRADSRPRHLRSIICSELCSRNLLPFALRSYHLYWCYHLHCPIALCTFFALCTVIFHFYYCHHLHCPVTNCSPLLPFTLATSLLPLSCNKSEAIFWRKFCTKCTKLLEAVNYYYYHCPTTICKW